MRAVWAVARNDLAVWMRSPWAIAAALVPPLAMALLIAVLTASVGAQPVALTVLGHGPMSERVAHLITADSEAYSLRSVSPDDARRLLRDQEVAAAVVVPADFDATVASQSAHLDLFLDNVDIDFADDIRRTVDRSVAEFDAPGLGFLGEVRSRTDPTVVPNRYRVAVREQDMRSTTVGFLGYQLVSVLVLVVLALGTVGTALLCARDSERRTARLLLSAPLSSHRLVAGRLLGGVVATTVPVVPLLLVAAVFGIFTPPAGHWPAVLLLCAVLVLLAVGLGVCVGVSLRQTRLVTMVAMVLATYLFFLGGGFATLAFLPGWVQAASRLVPTAYAIEGLRQALFYPDLGGFARDILALLAFAAAALLVATLSLGRAWRTA